MSRAAARYRRASWLALTLPFAAAAQDTRTVVEPVVPPVCVVLTAKASSTAADDTRVLQKAIDGCDAGRAVRLAAGDGDRFTSGPLALKSGVTLLIDSGVTLLASTDPRLYDIGRRTCGTNDGKGRGCRPFITANGTRGGGIMGDGVIDGQGGRVMDGTTETWWQLARRAQKERSRHNVPRLIEVTGAREFTLYRVTLRNSANFHVALDGVDGFTAWGVKIDAPADARNTDGIDPISSRNISIVHSSIRTGDDHVAIKAGRKGAAENISILNNRFYSGHGMSIGSETEGGVRNVLVEGLTIDGATSGLRIKSDVSRGGQVRNVRYVDVCMRSVAAPLDVDTHYDRSASGTRIPVYSGITFRHVRSLTPGRVILRGFDASHPLEATLDDVVVDGDPKMQVAHGRFALGPGPVLPALAGEDVMLTGAPGKGPGHECEQRFVAFPGDGRVASARPQLTDAQAPAYSYREVLKWAGGERLDPWDPLADALASGATRSPDYVVDGTASADGRATFNTVQAAVSRAVSDSAAAGRTQRIHILVKPGVYRELLYVPPARAPITIRGGGADAAATRITAALDALVSGSRYREMFAAQFAAVEPGIAAMFASLADRATVGTPGSAVTWIRNDGFQARNITFENAYNKESGDSAVDGEARVIRSQAVALMVDDADKVQFENVRFIGYQDTLYLKASSPARASRSFFHRSYIEGDMDFIFGEGTAYFHRSEIRTLGDRRVSYAIAPSTHYGSRFGFVFNESGFTHDGTANALAGRFKLARQWFRGQRCTPFGKVAVPAGYSCTLAAADSYEAPIGTISRSSLEAVGKVAILNSRIGAHIDKARPWADWNAEGTHRYRPVQYDSDGYRANLQAAGIDPDRQLSYGARKEPVEPFLAEYRNTEE
jgi:pectin methylesterase-like acyl-CoA thioesterase